MDKYELAKELTLKALENKYICNEPEQYNTKTIISECVAKNVAAFFNKLVEEIKIDND